LNNLNLVSLQAGWVTTPTSIGAGEITAHKKDVENLCILQGRTLHIVSHKRVCKRVILSRDYTSFWSLPCGLLLTVSGTETLCCLCPRLGKYSYWSPILLQSKNADARPVLLNSFEPPFTLQHVHLPSELSPLDIIWSSNKTIPPLSLLASYNATVSLKVFLIANKSTANNILSYYQQKSTISLWEVELSSTPRPGSDASGVGEATPTLKRA
jgi:hypothetical protein